MINTAIDRREATVSNRMLKGNMPDISKCNGFNGKKDCPLRANCYRFTSTSSEFYQAYVECSYSKSSKSCFHYWPNKPLTFDEAVHMSNIGKRFKERG